MTGNRDSFQKSPRSGEILDEKAVQILLGLRFIQVPALLRKEFDFSEPTFHRKKRALERLGLIVRVSGRSPAIFEITPQGREYIQKVLGIPPSTVTKRNPEKKRSKSPEDKGEKVFESVTNESPGKTPRKTPRSGKSPRKIPLLGDRMHNVLFTVPIFQAPRQFLLRLQKENWIVEKQMTNWKYWHGMAKWRGIQAQIQFMPTVKDPKVLIRIPGVWEKTTVLAQDKALDSLGEIKAWLEEFFSEPPTRLRLGDPISCEVSLANQHHAIPEHPFSTLALEAKFKGQTSRVAIDASVTEEVDFIDKRYSPNDCEREMKDSLHYSAEKGIYIKDLDERGNELDKNLNSVSNILKQTSEILHSHWTGLQSVQGQHDVLRRENLDLRDRLFKVEGKISLVPTIRERILKELKKGPMTRNELSEKLKIKLGSINCTIARLLKSRKLVRSGMKGKRGLIILSERRKRRGKKK